MPLEKLKVVLSECKNTIKGAIQNFWFSFLFSCVVFKYFMNREGFSVFRFFLLLCLLKLKFSSILL